MESASFTSEITRESVAARSPRVSVIMGAYNGDRFLRPAIESILNQTFHDFELIVVDDASNDRTPDVLREFADGRIKIVRNEHNLGIAATLNRALALACGEYVANQDHDDISLPTRFQKQVAFLDAHPDVALVSCDADVLTDNGTKIWVSVPHSDLELKCAMLLSTSIHHTGMMARKSAIDAVGGYSLNPEYRFAEDYDLFSRIAYRYRVENIRETLVQAYKHRNIASTLHCEEQSRSGLAISSRNIADLLSCNGEAPLTQNGAKVHASDSKREPFERYICRCMRAFSWGGPHAEAPGVGSVEMIVGVQAFCRLHNIIYRKYRFSMREVLDHKSRTRWTWGRRCVGLSRAECKLRLRLKFAALGIRLLWAGLASAVFKRLLIPRSNRDHASIRSTTGV